jgi:hypothetical protein
MKLQPNTATHTTTEKVREIMDKANKLGRVASVLYSNDDSIYLHNDGELVSFDSKNKTKSLTFISVEEFEALLFSGE